MPLHMRLPKARGLQEPVQGRVPGREPRTSCRALYPAGGEVDPGRPGRQGRRPREHAVKVLGSGEVSVALQVKANAFSGSAKEKMAAPAARPRKSERHLSVGRSERRRRPGNRGGAAVSVPPATASHSLVLSTFPDVPAPVAAGPPGRPPHLTGAGPEPPPDLPKNPSRRAPTCAATLPHHRPHPPRILTLRSAPATPRPGAGSPRRRFAPSVPAAYGFRLPAVRKMAQAGSTPGLISACPRTPRPSGMGAGRRRSGPLSPTPTARPHPRPSIPSSRSTRRRTMLTAFARAFRTPDLRKKLLFTLGIMALFRLGSHIPAPGVDTAALNQCLGISKADGTSNQASGPDQPLLRRRAAPAVDLRARHHAVHHRVDHPAAAHRRDPAPGGPEEGGPVRADEDHAVHPVPDHRRWPSCSRPRR